MEGGCPRAPPSRTGDGLPSPTGWVLRFAPALPQAGLVESSGCCAARQLADAKPRRATADLRHDWDTTGIQQKH